MLHHILFLFCCAAFVKSNRVDNFPNLSVRYIRGSDPKIELLDDRRQVAESLGINKWNTDTIEEFLKERLR